MIDAPLSTVTWEGEAPGVLLAHATGFCKELWGPVVDAMVPVAAVAFDQRGHGDSPPMPFPADWELIGADVAAVAASVNPQPHIAVGHSSGGAAAAIAAIAEPAAFAHLVLIEPVITPPPHERRDDAPMALAAERRRSSFPDRTIAREQLGRKGLFDRWHEAAVDPYLEHALRDEGGELVLKCTPATEAEHYRAGWEHPTWDHLDEIACPLR